MDNLKELLYQVSIITNKIDSEIQEKEARGENFNLFEILRLTRYEERLHTPLLAELLNPHGSHGLKDKFLRAFLEEIDCDIAFDMSSMNVTVEFNIGPISKHHSTGGRIDIFIEDKFHHAIIIENKIDAEDQKNQLLRYENFAKTNQREYQLIYLTLDGRSASERSLGNKTIDYKCISYRKNILNWINKCISLADNFPLVRETLVQYTNCLKALFNIMDNKHLNELIQVTTSQEYINSTLAIMANEWEICTEIRKRFVESLKSIADKYKLLMSVDEDICTLVNESYVTFYSPELSKHWGITIGADKFIENDGVYFGITQLEYNRPHVTKKKLAEIEHIWEEGEQESNFPYGWEYLSGEDDCWNDWSDTDTLRDMANGKLCKYIETKIIQPIIENKLLERIEEDTSK